MERLKYHFEPKKGWMNDPNGLVWFRGQYHAFFQYNPYDVAWGPMHWGHAVSDDLLHWEELPIAIKPDQPYENRGGCFSGSAIVKDGKLFLFYTSDGRKEQTQSIAFSEDGIHFQKYEGNPVIRYTPDYDSHFRDPKVSEIDGVYYMVVGAGNCHVGKTLLYRSDDLLHWDYQGVLFAAARYYPCMECPDFFRLGDKYVLVFSRMKSPAHKYAQLFVIGDFQDNKLVNYEVVRMERGGDFYAGQTFLDGKGRRILIGWMWNWGREVKPGAQWAGAFTIPRELSFQDGRLVNFPCAESVPLLKTESEYVQCRQGMVMVTDGVKYLRKYKEKEVESVHILEDTRSVEVFINGGRESWTFYKEA